MKNNFKSFLLAICLIFSGGAWAIPTQIKVVMTNVNWTTVGSCQGNVTGRVSLVSTDGCGSVSNYCNTCLSGNGTVQLIRYTGSGTYTTLMSTTFSQVAPSSSSWYDFSLTFDASTYGTGFAAGEYMVRVQYNYGGTNGTYCSAITSTNYAEGFSPSVNSVSGYNSYYYSTPFNSAPSALSYKIDNKSVSITSGSYSQFYACQNLSLVNTVTGIFAAGTQYTMTITKVGVSTPVTVSQTSPTFDLKTIIPANFGGVLTGQFSIKTSITSCSTTANYTGYIQINAAPSTTSTAFKINSKTLQTSVGTAQVVYSCSNAAITLTNLPTLPSLTHEYRVTLTKVDASGNPITGTGAFTISTAWSGTTIPTDLKSTSYSSQLANNANNGLYKVTLEARDVCASPIASPSTSGFINLSAPPTSPSMSTEMYGWDSDDHTSSGGTYSQISSSTTTLSAPLVLCLANGFSGFTWGIRATSGTGVVSKFSYKVFQGSSTTALFSSPLYTTSGYAGVSTNVKNDITYSNGVPYRIEISVYNDCTYPSSPVTKIGYFQVITACKKGNGGEATTGIGEEDISELVNIYPIPASNALTVELVKSNSFEKATLIDLTGKVVAEKVLSNNTANEIGLSNLAKGIYILHIEGNKSIYKRIVIE